MTPLPPSTLVPPPSLPPPAKYQYQTCTVPGCSKRVKRLWNHLNHAQFVFYERHTLSTRLMARQEAALPTRAGSTSSSESDATSGEDEEGERAADTGARDPPFHISSLPSPSSSFSSKQKRQQLLLSAGRACNVDRGFCKFAPVALPSSIYVTHSLLHALTKLPHFRICSSSVIPPPPPLRPPLYPPPFLYSPPSVLQP